MSYVGKESGLLLGKVPLFLGIYKHKNQCTKQNEHGNPKYQQISVEGCTCSCGSRGVDEGCLKDPVVQKIRETLPDIDLIPGIFYFIIIGEQIFTKNLIPEPDEHPGPGSSAGDEGCLRHPVVQQIREALPDIALIPGIFYFIIIGEQIFTKNPIPDPDDHSGLGSIPELLFQHRAEDSFQQVILIDDKSQMS